MVSREELRAIRGQGPDPEPTQEEPDRRDVAARLAKAKEDLDRVQAQLAELKEAEGDISRSREEARKTRDEIREREAEIREMSGTVEEKEVEAREAGSRIRTTAATTRRKAEEVRATVKEIEVKKESIKIRPPDIVDKIGAGVTALERPFAAVSGGLRRKAEEVRAGGDRGFDPSEMYTSAARHRRSPEAIKEGVGLALRAGASAFDAFTMPVRPVLLGETVVTTAKIVVDPKTRKAFLRSVATDPAGFGADIIGGAVGGYALGYGIGKVRQSWTRRRYLTDLPDEAFLVPEEAAFAYPQPETVSRVSTHDYLRKVGEVGVVDDFDVWSGPMTFDKGKMGFRRTGAELLPELVPDQAPTSSIYRPGMTRFIETAETFRPAVRFPLRPGVTPRAPLAMTTGLGVISSLRAPKEITRPEEIVDVVVEEAVRIMPDYSTRRRTRPKPTPPGFIEAPTIIERAGADERERDWVAPMYRPPRHVQRRRQRQDPIMDVTVDVAQREIETPPRLFFSWPTSYRRPTDTSPVYRPRMAKDALRGGRGSWVLFGEYRQYLKGDPLKVLEGF